MTDEETIKVLQKELRDLEEENTALRDAPKPPPSSTARHEVERLIFQVTQLRAQVERCQRELKGYQARIRELTREFYDRNPPKSP